MATTNYISMDGMLIGEVTGGVMRNYGTDALGSVVDTASNGVAENTYRYKPYGGTLAKTGSAADPSFLWNGGSGYRATTLVNSGYYVRRRHFSSTAAQWTTADPLWPAERIYCYAKSQPVSGVDYLGLGEIVGTTGSYGYCSPGAPVISFVGKGGSPGYWKDGDGVYWIDIYDDVQMNCKIHFLPNPGSPAPGGLAQWLIYSANTYNGITYPDHNVPRQDGSPMDWCVNLPSPVLISPPSQLPSATWQYFGKDAPGLYGGISLDYPSDCSGFAGFIVPDIIAHGFLPLKQKQVLIFQATYHTCCVCSLEGLTDDPASAGPNAVCVDWTATITLDSNGSVS